MAGNETQSPGVLSESAKSVLRAISSEVLPVRSGDGKAESEARIAGMAEYEEIERTRAETAAIRQKNRDRQINRRLRTNYAKAVMYYLVCYSAFVAVLLLLAGFKVCGFFLGEGVLEFLVGSTAVAAIGLVLAVTTGLFSGLGNGD